MARSTSIRNTALGALLAAGAVFVPLGRVTAQDSPVGIWNIRSRDMTDRATGGVRVVLLRVEQRGNDLGAEITSIRNTFMPVDEFGYDEGEMHVVFGSYEYRLRIDGEELEGTLVSPLGTQPVQGIRQHRTLMYVGDEPQVFHTLRPGILGASSGLVPPNDEPDPHGWMRSRVTSVDDVALVVGNRVKVPVQFTNARDFERQLLDLVGTRVNVNATWVGERLRIESIEPSTP